MDTEKLVKKAAKTLCDDDCETVCRFCKNRAEDVLDVAFPAIREMCEALHDIATDERQHGDDEVAIIYRMQDRARAALSLSDLAASQVEKATPNLKTFVDRFLAWELPKDVCADPCAAMSGSFCQHPRSGTNLLTAAQAEAMLRHVLFVPRESGEVNT